MESTAILYCHEEAKNKKPESVVSYMKTGPSHVHEYTHTATMSTFKWKKDSWSQLATKFIAASRLVGKQPQCHKERLSIEKDMNLS